MSPLDAAIRTVAWALLHFLWQGAFVWLATGLALRLTRSANPRIRYLIGCAGLALCLLLPPATAVHMHPRVARQAGELSRIVPAVGRPTRVKVPLPFVREGALAVPRKVGFMLEDDLPVVFMVWLAGILILTLRFGGGWWCLASLKGGAQGASKEFQERVDLLRRRLGFSRPIRLALSSRITTPMVVGWLRPLLLVPLGLLTDLDPVGLEALLVHELAHIRRHDYLVNLIQCLVEILLFYHPAVWWISRRVRAERELCCDDAAVAWCRDPLVLAEALARLQALRALAPSPALAAGGKDLLFRIKRLLAPPLPSSSQRARWKVAVLVGFMALVAGVGTSLRAMPEAGIQAGRWFLSGSNRVDYAFLPDPGTTRGGGSCLKLECGLPDPKGFGTVMQTLAVETYQGKRVRLSAWVRTAEVEGWAGLWMKVDGENHRCLALDNMDKRPIQGTTDWARYEVVLDVAPQAKGIALGLILEGKGAAWIEDPQLEIVDAGVPVTILPGGPAVPMGMAPWNWVFTGLHPEDYLMRTEPAAPGESEPSHLLASNVPDPQDFGALGQCFRGRAYLGKRVRLTARVKAEGVESSAGLWMRVDGPDGKSTAFDNMFKRPLQGTFDWTPFQIVLDMAPDSGDLALGILLNGRGKVWMEEPRLEVVDEKVPVTDLKGRSRGPSHG